MRVLVFAALLLFGAGCADLGPDFELGGPCGSVQCSQNTTCGSAGDGGTTCIANADWTGGARTACGEQRLRFYCGTGLTCMANGCGPASADAGTHD